MVVPCLSCVYLDKEKYEYEYDESRGFYNYHLGCKIGVKLPDPMVKDGFTCDKYESRYKGRSPAQRSQCAIEIRNE
ncbi:MAG TPA: hypothetical protein O0W90_04475 [Methanocorpusculum sp.]|nr:hypothetical protein [Methanocorpusculum sp.]